MLLGRRERRLSFRFASCWLRLRLSSATGLCLGGGEGVGGGWAALLDFIFLTATFRPMILLLELLFELDSSGVGCLDCFLLLFGFGTTLFFTMTIF